MAPFFWIEQGALVIRVTPSAEPASFDREVRQRGLRALRELRGEDGLARRPGRPRKPRARITLDDLPPYWRDCLDDLHQAYEGICAYSCFYIELVTGARTVDHMEAKSHTCAMQSPRLADLYEWRNYRLASLRMNRNKGTFDDVLDPFEVDEDGHLWFTMEFHGYQIAPSRGLDESLHKRVQDTIDRLRLNDHYCRRQREKYVIGYRERDISFSWLARHAPLVARELERQGLKLVDTADGQVNE